MNVITVKVECDCGQRYSFDVEPISARMPSSVACPVCGVDGTSKANEVLARSASPQKKERLTAKRILFSLIWAFIFFFGSAALIFVAWHAYFIVTGAPKPRASENTIMWLGASLVLGPLMFATLGAVLGVRGLLPGTRR